MQEQRSLFGEEEESEQKYVNDRTTHHYSVDTTEVADDPLVLLNDMMSGVFVGSTASFNRGRKILRPHDAEITDSWAFCVPRYFNDALDIKLTEVKIDKVPHLVWTQGTSFAFQRDDIIYDVPRKVWGDQLKEMKYSLIIESASSAMPPQKEIDEGDAKLKRKIVEVYLGSVRFKIMKPNADKTGLEYVETRSVTQADFVKVLITGI